jgi:hypothetical protein
VDTLQSTPPPEAVVQAYKAGVPALSKLELEALETEEEESRAAGTLLGVPIDSAVRGARQAQRAAHAWRPERAWAPVSVCSLLFCVTSRA